MRFDMVVFDLDGTLADTAGDIADAVNHALGGLGRPRLTDAQVRRMIGHGTRALMRDALVATGGSDDSLVNAGLNALTRFYERHLCRRTAAYDGVTETLDALRAMFVRSAICTNKPEHLAIMLVDALGWADKFDAIIGGDTLNVRKPDAAPLHTAIARCGGGRAVFVGDSITDADTARAAHLPFIAVDYGYLDRPAEQLGAAAVIGAFGDLIAAMETLAVQSAL